MRFAVISDLHGNLAATEAVFADIDRLGDSLEVVVCTGDIVGHAAHPNEVIALLRDRKVELIRGNYDEAVAGLRATTGADYAGSREEDVDLAAVRWTQRHLTAENLKLLQTMRLDARLQVTPGGRQAGAIRESEDPSKAQRRNTLLGLFVGGAVTSLNKSPRRVQLRSLLFVHGSPRDIVEYLYAGMAPSILRTIGESAKADVIIHGHTHQASRDEAGGVTFIGVGSVGRSRTGSVAEYSIVDIKGADLEVDSRSLPYDVEREANMIESSGLPPELADVLRRGSFPSPISA